MDISLCTVVAPNTECYLEILLDSVKRHCAGIKEIIVSHPPGIETDLVKTVKWSNSPLYHPIGLSLAAKHARGKYLWFCDSDVFVCSNVSGLWVDCMEKYNLSIVGVTHPVQPQIYGQFPCVISCMIRTREFPHDPLFLTEYPRNRKLSPRDQALRKLFPNPSLRPNVGWRLWHWNYQKKGKWLSFGEKDHFYVTEVNYHNLQDIPLPEQKLLYHEKSGTLSVRLKCKGKYKLVNVAKNSKFINFKKMYRENNV